MSLPSQVEDAMQNAIRHLAGTLRFEAIDTVSHRSLIVRGWDDNDTNIRSIACYLVGLLACSIDAALNIRASLTDTEEDRLEIWQSVLAIVGSTSDSLSETQKQDERNPWIAEGIWHLCMVIATQRVEFHPMGKIFLLHYPHIKAKDHGLDVAAIYQEENFIGISLVESKAYKDNPGKAISVAIGFFKEVNAGKHSARIRQAVQIMRTALSPEQNSIISDSFWKRNRSYIANPHYHATHIMDWSTKRDSLVTLGIPRENLAIMPNCISNFDSFFDSIAQEMRSFAGSL